MGQSVLIGASDVVDDEDIGRRGRRYEFKPQLASQGLKKTRSGGGRSLIRRSGDRRFGGPFEAEVEGSSKASSIQHLPIHAGEWICQEPGNSLYGYPPPADASLVGRARGDLAYSAARDRRKLQSRFRRRLGR